MPAGAVQELSGESGLCGGTFPENICLEWHRPEEDGEVQKERKSCLPQYYRLEWPDWDMMCIIA